MLSLIIIIGVLGNVLSGGLIKMGGKGFGRR